MHPSEYAIYSIVNLEETPFKTEIKKEPKPINKKYTYAQKKDILKMLE